jgi:hypothetical protein
MLNPPAFLLGMKQPMRGFVNVLIPVISGVLLMLVVGYWWKPWGAPGEPTADFSTFGTPIVLSLWLAGTFGWVGWWSFHAMNWPFQKVRQPWQGIFSFICANGGVAVTFWIFYYYLHWDAQIFSLLTAWYFWILVLSTMSGFPILSAYKGKQPLAGIVSFCVSWFLAFVTMYALPLSGTMFGKSVSVGFPFPWFVFAVLISWLFLGYPMGSMKQPLNVLVHVGILGFFMLVMLGVMRAGGLNYWDAVTSAHYLEGGVWAAIAINIALYVMTGFQMWPFHRLSFWLRAVVWLIIIFGLTALIWNLGVAKYAPAAATAEADPAAWFAHTSWIFWALAWNMCLFWAWVGWFFHTYAGFLPPAEGTTPPCPTCEVEPPAEEAPGEAA